MIKRFYLTIITIALSALSACAIKPSITSQYQLDRYSDKQFSRHATDLSILVNLPEAASAYQTEQMHYVKKPFELSSFANNAWISSPADLLFPLLVKSIQRSGYFYAVASSTNSEQTDYRLDTQLLELEQNFLTKPSRLLFAAKVILTHVPDKRVVASRLISKQIACPADNPYGGVVAANMATQQFTYDVTAFILKHVKQDSHSQKMIVQ